MLGLGLREAVTWMKFTVEIDVTPLVLLVLNVRAPPYSPLRSHVTSAPRTSVSPL